MPDTDAELWARGDKAAFAALFDRHAEAVWNHAYRLTASWSLAEDLTSAELEPGEKDRISHRGRALRALAPQVAADLSGD